MLDGHLPSFFLDTVTEKTFLSLHVIAVTVYIQNIEATQTQNVSVACSTVLKVFQSAKCAELINILPIFRFPSFSSWTPVEQP